MQHDLFEGLQKVFLEVEARELFFNKELVGELSQRIYRENRDVEVFVRSDMDKVLAEHLPNSGPNESNTGHVQISYFNQSLQTELS